MKVTSIVGARPQFIKVKPVIDELKKKKIQHILVHTGQHYDYEMSKIFFNQLHIPKPKCNLGIGSCSQAQQTALMLAKIEKVLLRERPDLVIVYGDTNSTLAGALAAAKLNIRVAHVEAGLRSYNRSMPEEVNRVITDHISDLLFCPTKTAVKNLRKEGINKGVYLVGDVMHDVFIKSRPLLKKRKILSQYNLTPKKYLLLTIHRPQNTDNIINLKTILSALITSRKTVVFPVHPRAEKALKKIKGLEFKSFLFLPPVSYLDMLVLEKNAKKIITDSGGMQKEAFWFGVPCITLRAETEWVETVKNGQNVLVGVNGKEISREINNFNSKRPQKYMFNDMNASINIIRVLKNFLHE